MMPKYERPYDIIVIEGLCSLTDQLEKTVVRLQQDIADYRAELKISGTHTPAVSVRDGDSVQTTVKAPTPTQEVNAVEKMQQQLVTDTHSPTELCSFIAGQRRQRRPPQRQRPARRDWSDGLCFSCGKLGHAAARCRNLNDSFPFMQPGWQMEKTPDGFMMIPPRVAMDRRRAENDG